MKFIWFCCTEAQWLNLAKVLSNENNRWYYTELTIDEPGAGKMAGSGDATTRKHCRLASISRAFSLPVPPSHNYRVQKPSSLRSEDIAPPLMSCCLPSEYSCPYVAQTTRGWCVGVAVPSLTPVPCVRLPRLPWVSAGPAWWGEAAVFVPGIMFCTGENDTWKHRRETL